MKKGNNLAALALYNKKQFIFLGVCKHLKFLLIQILNLIQLKIINE